MTWQLSTQFISFPFTFARNETCSQQHACATPSVAYHMWVMTYLEIYCMKSALFIYSAMWYALTEMYKWRRILQSYRRWRGDNIEIDL